MPAAAAHRRPDERLAADQPHFRHQVIVRRSRDDILQAVVDSSTADQILYFYCHAISKALGESAGPHDSGLVLSDDGYITGKGTII